MRRNVQEARAAIGTLGTRAMLRLMAMGVAGVTFAPAFARIWAVSFRRKQKRIILRILLKPCSGKLSFKHQLRKHTFWNGFG